MINLDEFMVKARKSVDVFEEQWNGGIRSDNSEQWPEWLDEGDWWEQFIIHVSDEN